jgi:hypothetical protein
MSTTLIYPDAYLSKFCTVDREARAFKDIDDMGTFADVWRNKLTILRTYILACLENQAEPDDLFSAKLKTYRQEFELTIAQARAATPNDEGLTLPMFTIPLERG